MNQIGYAVADRTLPEGRQFCVDSDGWRYLVFYAHAEAQQWVERHNALTADPASGGPDRFHVVEIILTPTSPSGPSVLTVTKDQLWSYLAAYADGDYESYRDSQLEDAFLDRATFDALTACDLKTVTAGQGMSENHPGGDDIVSVAEGVVAAIAEGYTIVTWYGPDAEALVAGYKPDQLTVINPPDTEEDE